MLVLRSLPAEFSIHVARGERRGGTVVHFPVPIGTWTGGRWDVAGCIPSGAPLARMAAGSDTLVPDRATGERYTASAPVGPAMLAAIRGAADGRLAVEIVDLFRHDQPDGAVDIVQSFTLSLVGCQNRGDVGVLGAVVTTTYYPATVTERGAGRIAEAAGRAGTIVTAPGRTVRQERPDRA